MVIPKKRSHIALLVGAALAASAILFPPWNYSYQRQGISQVQKPAGYSFIFTPPRPQEKDSAYGVVVDWSRMALQLRIVVVLTTGAWFWFEKAHDYLPPTQFAEQSSPEMVFYSNKIIKTIKHVLDAPTVSGRGHYSKEYLTDQRYDAIGKMQAGLAQHVLYEANHYIAVTFGFESDPSQLLADVVNGFKQFDYDSKRPICKAAMQEGFVEYLRKRSVDDLVNLTPEQEAAANYCEMFLRIKALTGRYDHIRELFREFKKHYKPYS